MDERKPVADDRLSCSSCFSALYVGLLRLGLALGFADTRIDRVSVVFRVSVVCCSKFLREAQDFGVSEGGARTGGQVGRCESHRKHSAQQNSLEPRSEDVTGQGGYKLFV